MGIRSVLCVILVLLITHVDARVRAPSNNGFRNSDQDTTKVMPSNHSSQGTTQAPSVDLCKMKYARCTIDFGVSIHASYKGLYTSDSKAKEATYDVDNGYQPAKSGKSTYGPDDIVEISQEPIGVSAYLLFYKIFGFRVDYLYNQYTVKEDIFTDESAIDKWKITNETLVTSLMLSMYFSDYREDEGSQGLLLYALLGKAYVWRTDNLSVKEGVYIQGDPKSMGNSAGYFFGLGIMPRLNSVIGIELEIGLDAFDFKSRGIFEIPDAETTSDGGPYIKIGLALFLEMVL
ncbi:MAG: hypothetical protein OCD01_04380 [Fibrobacterales bacterium]